MQYHYFLPSNVEATTGNKNAVIVLKVHKENDAIDEPLARILLGYISANNTHITAP